MATDFFEQQDIARKRTGLLVAYFVLAVIAIVVAVYAAATGIWLAASKGDAGGVPLWDWQRLAIVSTGVGFVVLAGSLYKTATLAEGGAAIARLMGGEVVEPGVATPAQRQLLNVVEEMAIASGTPVPTVYVLPNESSINAFAAGHQPGDAVVAVSQGTLDHLSRDELQGVVAHEFSHILNGDMRLNLRLIGLLHGILLLALIGQMILRILGNSSNQPVRRSNRKDDDKGNSGGVILAILAMGVALLAIGWIGVFFGRLIKAAISRQREFLADASAVQFTRNPEGIVGALKKIGGLVSGSQIASPNAEQASHMFFGAGVPFWLQAFSTHPPLAERIRRLDPSFDGTFPEVSEDEQVAVADEEETTAGFAGAPVPRGGRATIPLDPAKAVSSVGSPRREHVAYATSLLDSLPDPLAMAVREPFGARAVVFALLFGRDVEVRSRQLAIIEDQTEPGTAQVVLQIAPLVDSLDAAARLPLAELAMPALRQLSPRQYQSFRARIDPLILADRTVTIFELALQRMFLRHLDGQFRGRPPAAVKYAAIGPIVGDVGLLLSMLAQTDRPNSGEAVHAYDLALGALGDGEGWPPMRRAEECSMTDLGRALDRLALASPSIKRRVLDACATCIAADGRVTIAEGELLRAIADSLDCPMPPLLSSARAGHPADDADVRSARTSS